MWYNLFKLKVGQVMDIVNIANQLSTIAVVKNVAKDEYEIITGANIAPKTPAKIYLINSGGQIKLTDKKSTLKYMNNLYELKAPDVKSCISSVIKLYGFTIASGELQANIVSEDSVKEIFYNFIICMGQLANMYAFFDKP